MRRDIRNFTSFFSLRQFLLKLKKLFPRKSTTSENTSFLVLYSKEREKYIASYSENQRGYKLLVLYENK